jgi:hypothetical protein
MERGTERSSFGPYYSPECVEETFSEVHMQNRAQGLVLQRIRLLRTPMAQKTDHYMLRVRIRCAQDNARHGSER